MHSKVTVHVKLKNIFNAIITRVGLCGICNLNLIVNKVKESTRVISDFM